MVDASVDAFYWAVEPYLDKMARVAGRIAGSQDRDDVVQESLVQAWKHRSTYDAAKGTLSAWLLAVTAHEAAAARRRASRRLWPVRREPSPTDAEQTIDLGDSLRSLTARERLAVDCFYFAGLSIRETAEVMGCSEGTVKSTLASARQRLRTLLR